MLKKLLWTPVTPPNSDMFRVGDIMKWYGARYIVLQEKPFIARPYNPLTEAIFWFQGVPKKFVSSVQLFSCLNNRKRLCGFVMPASISLRISRISVVMPVAQAYGVSFVVQSLDEKSTRKVIPTRKDHSVPIPQ
jgi:hypothetical protein